MAVVLRASNFTGGYPVVDRSNQIGARDHCSADAGRAALGHGSTGRAEPVDAIVKISSRPPQFCGDLSEKVRWQVRSLRHNPKSPMIFAYYTMHGLLAP